MPDAHENQADSKKDDERRGERQDCLSPVDPGAFGFRGCRDRILVGDSAYLFHQLGFGRVTARPGSSSIVQPEHLGHSGPFQLPVGRMEKCHEARAFDKEGQFARRRHLARPRDEANRAVRRRSLEVGLWLNAGEPASAVFADGPNDNNICSEDGFWECCQTNFEAVV